MQSLILVLLSIGAASAAPQQFFVLPDILASAQTHSGLSHQELVPVVIPIGDHSHQKSESSSSDFDVFMKVPEGQKESTNLSKDVSPKMEENVLQEKNSDASNPVEMLLNELQGPKIVSANKQSDDASTSLPTLNSETDTDTAEIQEPAVLVEIPEKHTPTLNEGSKTITAEVGGELGATLEEEGQVADAAVSSLTDVKENLEGETEKPKGNVTAEEVHENVNTVQNIIKTDAVENIKNEDTLKVMDTQEPTIQKQATEEAEEILQEQPQVKEATVDVKDITEKQEEVDVAVTTDEKAEVQRESTAQDAVIHENLSEGQKVNEAKAEKTFTKSEDVIHEKSSSSTGKTLLQGKVKDEVKVHTLEITAGEHTVEEEPKVEDIKDEAAESTADVEETTIKVLENEQTTPQEKLSGDPQQVEEVLLENVEEGHEGIAEIKLMEEAPIQTEQIEVKHFEDAAQPHSTEVQSSGSEDATQDIQRLSEEVPATLSEDVAPPQPTKAQSSLPGDAVEATPQFTEEVPLTPSEDVAQQQPTEVQSSGSEDAALDTQRLSEEVPATLSEDVAQPQPTEAQSALPEDAVEATLQLTEEVPLTPSEDVAQQQSTEVQSSGSNDAAQDTQRLSEEVPATLSEDVAHPQPREAQSSLSGDAVEATPQLTEEAPLTASEDVAQQQPTEVHSPGSEDAAQDTQRLSEEVPATLSEDLAHPQLTEAQSSLSGDAGEATPPLTEEVPLTSFEDVAQQQPTEVHSPGSEDAAQDTQRLSEEVPSTLSEDVAHPQHTEAQSSLSGDAVETSPQLTEEVPLTPSKDVSQTQPTKVQSSLSEAAILTTPQFAEEAQAIPFEAAVEVEVKEEITDALPVNPDPIAERASESISDITLSEANHLENQITDSIISKTKSPAKSNLIPNNGKSINSASESGFRMESVGLAVKNHFGFSSHIVKMPEPVQYLHNGAFVDPRTLVEPRYRPFFYHNDSPDIVRAKVLFFQHQGNISPKF